MRRRTLLKAMCLPAAAAASSPREFVLGLYSLPRAPDAWKQARDAGFDVINVRATAEDMAQVRAHNLRAWIRLGSISPQRRSETEEKIRRIVQAYKDDPALLFWETEDEPAFVWKKRGPRVPPENVIATYRFIKSIDPAHPVYLNHAPVNLVSTLQQYNAGADIVSTDVYPVIPHGIRELYALWPDGRQGDLLNCHISHVGQYADKMRQVAGDSRAVFMVLQAFAWENLRRTDRDPAMVLYPTREQIRFMTYQSIVHGAQGVIYWGLSTNPPDAPVWSSLQAIARELHQIKRDLGTAPALPVQLAYHDTGHSLDRGLEWTARGSLLIAVNADPNPLDVTISGLERFARCEVLFESRQPACARGRMRQSFAPFDARIYRLS